MKGNMKQKRLRKLFPLLLLVVMLAGLLTGCGDKSEVGASNVKKVDDLETATIGVQLGTTGDIYASDYKETGATIQQFNKGADAVQALKQGKVDCVVIDEQPAKAFVERNRDLSILEEDFVKEEYAICIAKDNDQLLKKVNKALNELKKDGTLKQIIGNYIGDSTKGKQPYESPEDRIQW